MLKFHPLTLAVALLLPLGAVGAEGAAAAPNAVSGAAPAPASAVQGRSSFDGVVEAVRQTTLAAQVPGAVLELAVKVGDRVQAGQLLLRIDARSADQNAAASDAQVQAARASLDVATREYTRQQKLREKQYISQAALDQAEAQFKATRAQVAAQVAQAGAARTQTGLHTVRAPYAGVVSDVPVQLGDMAMPGRALVTLYDPSALRVTASVPQSLLGAAHSAPAEAVSVELPGLIAAQQWPATTRVQVLPTIDAATHTVQVRADLAKGLDGVAPGMFARVWLPMASQSAAAASQRVSVPLSAVVRRAEMTGVYVQGEGGKSLLRQVRLGRVEGGQVELLSGVSPGESVVLQPQATTRAQPQTAQ
ncbi:MAG: efflux RND transporter periplasmic adaptor subunit [Giesbergeria sp.]|nr:efflux RND transporter periplasmic adaptor subunit [Giesbergeria sp.]MBP6419642.1 efflux RND transporter periplasmic adaptor subunit [Giesbergeria sp.]